MSERNYESYFNLMSKSMVEKVQYIIDDLITCIKRNQQGLIIDFGGANGKLLSLIKDRLDFEVTNKLTYIIIEKQEVIDIVEPGFKTDDILFMTLEDFNFEYRNSPMNRYVIFSSVLHELFSVNKPTVDEVFKKYFDVLLREINRVYIRDMYFGGSLGALATDCRSKAAEKYHNQYNEYMGCVSIPSHEKIFEFLMKTRYLNHWDQEKKEYYFSVPYLTLIERFATYGLHTSKVEKYRNNHIIDEIEERMNWDNQFNDVTHTHIKMIFNNFKWEVK